MTGMAWTQGRIRDTCMVDNRLDLSNFRSTSFANSVFSSCNMRMANFQDSDLRGATFRGCDLTGVQFSGSRMDGARFVDCVLDEVNGVASMAGALVATGDLVALAYSLANALGIQVSDDETY
jgi:uncharacterized protein YjbI with pentapeptide repeats